MYMEQDNTTHQTDDQAQAAAQAAAEAAAAEVAAAEAEAAAATAKSKGKNVKARVLVTGQYGEINDLVSLPADVAKTAEESGQIDTSKAAVAYAAILQAATE